MSIVVREVLAKTVLTKSGVEGVDYVINPYAGCLHDCRYCYARYMRKYTGRSEAWGSFVDVKINAPELVRSSARKTRGHVVTLSTVTDPYQPVEKRYRLTRRILRELVVYNPCIRIMTKSPLVLRDMDILSNFEDCSVSISLAMNDERLRKQLEPILPSAKERYLALQKIKEAGIKAVLFISPIFPEITKWKEIIEETRSIVDEYWFENLNLYPSVRGNVLKFVRANFPDLVEVYQEIIEGNKWYWLNVADRIEEYCRRIGVSFRMCFH